ncbi:unnamed protein product [Cunninghamella blakesleeana]
MGHITDLPQELYRRITKGMKTSSILRLSRTCRKLFFVIRNDNSGIWETLDCREYIEHTFERSHMDIARFLCTVFTEQSRKSIKYLYLRERYASPIMQVSYHNYERTTNINHWHILVKSLCPNLISLVFDVFRGRRPPPNHIFTIRYNIIYPLFESPENENSDSKYYHHHYDDDMEYDFYISTCEDCSHYVCSNSNSNFLCDFHFYQRILNQ